MERSTTRRFPKVDAVLALCLVASWVAWASAQRTDTVALDPDDIGGVVTGAKGPEAGVWVIAETTDLPTTFAKIVVTDDRGRYLLPDLPKASYNVWVRGYGLVDSPKVKASPGVPLNLSAVMAPDARAAARYYPANYWFALLRVPSKDNFPGNGAEGSGIPGKFDSPEAYAGEMKRACINCHQMGSEGTRTIPADHGSFPSSIAAWEHRLKAVTIGKLVSAEFDGSGSRGLAAGMMGGVKSLGQQPTLAMFADWTDRIAAGALPPAAPPRPSGVERNVVLTMWEWGEPVGFLRDAVSTDKRRPTINANGPIYAGSQTEQEFASLNPVTHQVTLGRAPVEGSPHTNAMDHKGRVWSTLIDFGLPVPEYCKGGSGNKFGQYFPNERVSAAMLFDPATKTYTRVPLCFRTHHLEFASDADNTLFFSNNDASGSPLGWVNTRLFDETKDAEASQGWCPAVLDTNGDGKITRGWTEPNQPIDPAKDHRIAARWYGVGINPIDGSVWGASSSAKQITRMERGSNPPETCRFEVFEPPPGTGTYPEGISFDRNGIAWIDFNGSGHIASFDRRKCTVLNGPNATGQHCAAGWKFYPIPGPKIQGADASADYPYIMWVDQFDTFGLGANTPMTQGTNSDSILALNPATGQWVTLRVPYPLGFFTRSHDGRIDDPNAGWKGRGLWGSFSSTNNWHIEGGQGTKGRAVKFQMRPSPLAK